MKKAMFLGAVLCALSSTGCFFVAGYAIGEQAALAAKHPKFCHATADCEQGKYCSLVAGHAEGACLAKHAPAAVEVADKK